MKVKLQFDFCPKCKYFKSCYITDGKPHYLSEDCLNEYNNGLYDEILDVSLLIREKQFNEQIDILNEKTDELLKQLSPQTSNVKILYQFAVIKGLEKLNEESEDEFRERVCKSYEQI